MGSDNQKTDKTFKCCAISNKVFEYEIYLFKVYISQWEWSLK